jgi:hypothetical protein
MDNTNITVWRYFTLIKFIDFARGNLYFTRGDKFEDKFEGRLPLYTVKQFEEYFDINPESSTNQAFPDVLDVAHTFMQSIRDGEMMNRQMIAISCWHMNEYESAAMWKLYTQNNYGIAVKSNIDLLKNIDIPKEYNFVINDVEYIDHYKHEDPEGWKYIFKPSMLKRKEFEHEKEIRLFLHKHNYKSDMSALPEEGIKVKIKPEEVIEEVIASPYLQKWEFDVLKDIISKYGLELKESTFKKNIDY